MAVSLAGRMFRLLRFKPTKTLCPTPGAKVGSCHRITPSMSRDQVWKRGAGALARAEATSALIWVGHGPARSGRSPPEGLTANLSLGLTNTLKYSDYLHD